MKFILLMVSLFTGGGVIAPTDGLRVAEKPQFVDCSASCNIKTADGIIHIVVDEPAQIWETHEPGWHE